MITFATDWPAYDRRCANTDSKVARKADSYSRIGPTVALEQTVFWFVENEGRWRPLLAGRDRAGKG